MAGEHLPVLNRSLNENDLYARVADGDISETGNIAVVLGTSSTGCRGCLNNRSVVVVCASLNRDADLAPTFDNKGNHALHQTTGSRVTPTTSTLDLRDLDHGQRGRQRRFER